VSCSPRSSRRREWSAYGSDIQIVRGVGSCRPTKEFKCGVSLRKGKIKGRNGIQNSRLTVGVEKGWKSRFGLLSHARTKFRGGRFKRAWGDPKNVLGSLEESVQKEARREKSDLRGRVTVRKSGLPSHSSGRGGREETSREIYDLEGVRERPLMFSGIEGRTT